MVLPVGQAGVLSNSLSPKIAEDGAVISHVASTPFRLDAQYCSLFKIVADQWKGQLESHRDVSTRQRPDQWWATIMIAITMNTATGERARSSDSDFGFAASGRGMT
jgi:hypothetical protein